MVEEVPNPHGRPPLLPRFHCLRCGALASYPPSLRGGGVYESYRAKFCSPACYRASLDWVAVLRFWDRVALGDGCWEWQGSRDRDGYGVTQADKVWKSAHRLAWEVTRGAIPEGRQVCHTCDNRACVKPSHLWLGDHTTNAHDRDGKGRWAGGHPGGAPSIKRLSPERRADLEGHYLLHTLPPRLAAANFGVSVRTVRRLVRPTRTHAV